MTNQQIDRLIWRAMIEVGLRPPLTESEVEWWERNFPDSEPTELPEKLRHPPALHQRVALNPREVPALAAMVNDPANFDLRPTTVDHPHDL